MAKFRLQRKESQAEFRKILLETRKPRECSRWKDGVLWNNLSMTCELLQNRKNIPSAPIPVLLSLKAAFSWGKSQSSRSLFLVTRGCGWGGGVLLDPRQFSIHHWGLLNWILYFGYEFHRHYVLVLSSPQNVKANNGEKMWVFRLGSIWSEFSSATGWPWASQSGKWDGSTWRVSEVRGTDPNEHPVTTSQLHIHYENKVSTSPGIRGTRAWEQSGHYFSHVTVPGLNLWTQESCHWRLSRSM